ncbi:hypothetical protein EST38_g8715 [Candolleomyces aberdarensis]|uniref:Uncharacterized protein n=1 Tax=Candolleomyces aberdarensis TaxID=2316362 RepID=A0A4Q2DBR8_9AGAR|nr:hypothetical protein EST38_g8715 [Candolleomyces aberdarensis]
MSSLRNLNLYTTALSQVNKELILQYIQSGYIILRNSARKVVFIFDLVNNTWLLDKLRVPVQIDYPAIATMPLGDVHLGGREGP